MNARSTNNPCAQKMAKLRQAFLDTVLPSDIQEITCQLIEAACEGISRPSGGTARNAI